MLPLTPGSVHKSKRDILGVMIRNRRFILSIGIALILLGLIIWGIVWLVGGRSTQPLLPPNAPGTTLPGNGPITIVLSPDFGDAVLSLGGMLAQHARPAIVATFFTGEPSPATSTAFDTQSGFTNSTIANNVRTAENDQALSSLGVVPENYGYLGSEYGQPIASDVLESDIAQDIQALLVANADREVYVYGPADFGAITSPDDEALHTAFTDALNSFPATNTHFFYYETYPTVQTWNTTATTSLRQFLQNESGLFLTTKNISLSSGQVAAKISALKEYHSLVQVFQKQGTDIASADQQFTSTRCAGQACEVVYAIGQN